MRRAIKRDPRASPDNGRAIGTLDDYGIIFVIYIYKARIYASIEEAIGVSKYIIAWILFYFLIFRCSCMFLPLSGSCSDKLVFSFVSR